MEMDENVGILAGAMLPPSFQPSNEILRLIASIDEFKGEWRASGRGCTVSGGLVGAGFWDVYILSAEKEELLADIGFE